MCIDNPTVKPEPGAVAKLQNEEIGAYVQREIFAHESFARLRARYVGRGDLELLKMAVMQSGFLLLLEGGRHPVKFYEEEFAR